MMGRRSTCAVQHTRKKTEVTLGGRHCFVFSRYIPFETASHAHYKIVCKCFAEILLLLFFVMYVWMRSYECSGLVITTAFVQGRYIYIGNEERDRESEREREKDQQQLLHYILSCSFKEYFRLYLVMYIYICISIYVFLLLKIIILLFYICMYLYICICLCF